MTNLNIAPCGLDCLKCRVFVATLANDLETLIKVGLEWGKSYNRPIAAEEVMCDGCRAPSDRVWLGCRDCGLRQCERSKQAMTCAHCAGFPCEKTREFETRWGTDFLTKANAAMLKKVR